MRIVVVNNFFPPRVGGSSHMADGLARGYARHGHEVIVITAAYQDAPAEEVREGVRVIRVPSVTMPDFRLQVSFDLSFATRPGLTRRLGRLLDEFRPDVIHQHGQFFDLTWATARYARRRGIPVLLTVHTRLVNPDPIYHQVFRSLDATMVAPRLRRYRPSIAVMDTYIRDYVTERYRGGYRDLVPIPVGLEPEWARSGSRDEGRRLMGLADDVPVILSVGHVIPVRDRVGLIESLPQVLEKHPLAKVVVAGHVYYDAFLRKAEELGVMHAVELLGAVPSSDIPHLLAGADIESHEMGFGIGIASLEAMAAGLTVVAWGREENYIGIPFVDGEHMLLTEARDVDGQAERICAALDDPDYRAAIGARAQQIIDEHFTFQHVLERHLEVLTDLALPGPSQTNG